MSLCPETGNENPLFVVLAHALLGPIHSLRVLVFEFIYFQTAFGFELASFANFNSYGFCNFLVTVRNWFLTLQFCTVFHSSFPCRPTYSYDSLPG